MSVSVGSVSALGGDASSSAPAAAVLAFDIGGTKLAAGVVDAAGQVLSFGVEPTRSEEGAERTLARLWQLGHGLIAEAGVELSAVGIGCGGPLDPGAGVLTGPPHLTGWRDVPIVAMAEQEFGLPALLENDATAAAAGEHRWGAGAGTQNMIYLTISTGVGGGIVIDGKLYRGSVGNGGELGHVTVDWHGRPCNGCGRLGCLEAYVSGTSIAERAREALAASGGGSTLADLETITASDVADAAAAGDVVATGVWDETVEALACGVTSLVNLFEPELVVIGGGVSRTGEQLLGPVRDQVRQLAMKPAAEGASVVAAALGDQVGVVGAAAVVFERTTSLSAARG